MQYTKEVWVSV